MQTKVLFNNVVLMWHCLQLLSVFIWLGIHSDKIIKDGIYKQNKYNHKINIIATCSKRGVNDRKQI